MKYKRDKKYCIKCHPPNVNISVEFQPWWKSPLLLFNDWFDHSKVYYIPLPWAFCRQYWNFHLKANSWKKCLYFDSHFTEVYPWGSNWKQIRIGSGTGSALSRWLATILAKLAHTGITRPQIQYVFMKISIFTTQSIHAIFIVTLHCRFSKHFCCPGSSLCVLSVWLCDNGLYEFFLPQYWTWISVFPFLISGPIFILVHIHGDTIVLSNLVHICHIHIKP